MSGQLTMSQASQGLTSLDPNHDDAASLHFCQCAGCLQKKSYTSSQNFLMLISLTSHSYSSWKVNLRSPQQQHWLRMLRSWWGEMIGSPFTAFTYCDLSDVHIQFWKLSEKNSQSVAIAAGENLCQLVEPVVNVRGEFNKAVALSTGM